MRYARAASILLFTFIVGVIGAVGCNAPSSKEPAEPASGAPNVEPTPAPETPAPPAAAPESTPDVPKTAEPPEPPAPEPEPQFVQVELPAGTVLELELLTALDSEIQRAGDEIQARTVSPLYVEGSLALDAGAYVEGKISEAKASGRVKGRARLAFTFDRMKTPTGLVAIRTSYVEQEAESGKKKDAAVIGGAAGVGAIVGGIIGGKKGAAIGASVGGAGGTGVVLSTKGEEIRLPVGSRVNVRLDEPVVIERK